MSTDGVFEIFDDHLACPEVGNWSEEKHRLVSLYAKLFASGMKAKWDQRFYLELYSGAGYSRIRGTNSIIAGSPLRALALQHPFDKYVFCEENNQNLAALRARVERAHPSLDVTYIAGNCNQRVDDILATLPQGEKGNTALTLCFADPYDIGLKFGTLRKLSSRYVDFLILLALYMDANRNY